MDNQKVLFYFLVIFVGLLFVTTFSNIYNSKVNEIAEGFEAPLSNAFNRRLPFDILDYLSKIEPFGNYEGFQNLVKPEFPVIKIKSEAENELSFLEGIITEKNSVLLALPSTNETFDERLGLLLTILGIKYIRAAIRDNLRFNVNNPNIDAHKVKCKETSSTDDCGIYTDMDIPDATDTVFPLNSNPIDGADGIVTKLNTFIDSVLHNEQVITILVKKPVLLEKMKNDINAALNGINNPEFSDAFPIYFNIDHTLDEAQNTYTFFLVSNSTSYPTRIAGIDQDIPTVHVPTNSVIRGASNTIAAQVGLNENAINRIRDTHSRLGNINERLDMVDDIYENADALSKHYSDFHNEYQEKLEEILKQKFDADENKFDVKNRIQSHRLQQIKDDLKELEELKNSLNEVEESSPNATPRGQSLRSLADGTRLNFEYVVENGRRTNKIIISINGGCLAFGDESQNGTLLTSVNHNCGEYRTIPTLHFEIHSVNNTTEYNNKINYVNNGTKQLAIERDNITFPFKLISPTQHFGHCLDIKDGALKVVPCTKVISQRFKISNSQVLGVCPSSVSSSNPESPESSENPV